MSYAFYGFAIGFIVYFGFRINDIHDENGILNYMFAAFFGFIAGLLWPLTVVAAGISLLFFGVKAMKREWVAYKAERKHLKQIKAKALTNPNR